MIDRIVLTPDGSGLKVILGVRAGHEREQPDAGRIGLPIRLVAGAGFEPATFRL
jgi:hypothetical protein